ncbi:MAG TPA: hypothetical protein VF006_23015 [Longimicrobium sp.]
MVIQNRPRGEDAAGPVVYHLINNHFEGAVQAVHGFAARYPLRATAACEASDCMGAIYWRLTFA